MTVILERLEPSQVQTTEAASCKHGEKGNVAQSIDHSPTNGNIDPSDTRTIQMDPADDLRRASKAEVNVVPLANRKVLPTEDDEALVETQNVAKISTEPVRPVPGPITTSLSKAKTVPTFSFKNDNIKSVNKQDISSGLTHFMVEDKIKELCSQMNKDQRLEKLPKGKSPQEKNKSELRETKQEDTVGTTTLVLQETDHVTEASSAPIGLSETSYKIPSSKICSLPSVVGSVPSPKSTPSASLPGVTSATTSTTHFTPPACKSPCLLPSHSVLGANPCGAGRSVPNPSPGSPLPSSGNIPVQEAAVSQKEVQWSFATCLTNILMGPWS